MPGGHKHILIHSLSINVPLSGHFFLTFCLNKIVMGKKDRSAVVGCKDDRLFPEKHTVLSPLLHEKFLQFDWLRVRDIWHKYHE